jgi:hypothetical protein
MQVLCNMILIFGVLVPLSTIFSAISWRPVLVVEEAGVPRENHQPTQQDPVDLYLVLLIQKCIIISHEQSFVLS